MKRDALIIFFAREGGAMSLPVGSWKLCAWSALWGHEFELDENAVEKFLYQEFPLQDADANEGGDAEGGLLTIDHAGAFRQQGRGSFPVVTYDAEGVQVAGLAEFDGDIHKDGERCYLLRRELPAWATPKDPLARTRLRWDDGDTKICDSVKLVAGKLVRMICVVTDECYGDRVMLFYNRLPSSGSSGNQ